jgi:sugar transferase (PEP-CTERM/EpsH1 system associated)
VKIAFLCARPPYPPNAGGRIRTFHLLTQISRQHDVTLVTATEADAEEVSLDALRAEIPRVDVKAIRVGAEGALGRLVRALRNPVDPLPFTWARYRRSAFIALVRASLAGKRFDIVHCDHVQIAHALHGLETAPRVLNAHNVESLLIRRMGEHAGSGWRKAAIAWQARKTLHAECRSFRLFDRCLAVSEEDGAEIGRMVPGLPVSVVPNGVDVVQFTPQALADGEPEIVFTGAMDWAPNVDGVTFFAGEILPRIRQRVPSARLSIVGRNPSASLIRRLEGDAVRFTGSVDDVRPYLARARVVVVPLRIGGGTRLKILEAWALGKPVVSTRLGAEGLPAKDGENIALADTPDAFAERTIGLLGDALGGGALGAAGRRLVEERFSWERVTRDLVEAYEATLGGATRAGARRAPAAGRREASGLPAAPRPPRA